MPGLFIDRESDYRQGFIDGLRAFAWWKDGEQYVGSCGTLFKDVKNKPEEVAGYLPPIMKKVLLDITEKGRTRKDQTQCQDS